MDARLAPRSRRSEQRLSDLPNDQFVADTAALLKLVDKRIATEKLA